MTKSTLIKWAAAAILAVPAVPTLGAHISHFRMHSGRTSPIMMAATATPAPVAQTRLITRSHALSTSHALAAGKHHVKHHKMHHVAKMHKLSASVKHHA